MVRVVMINVLHEVSGWRLAFGTKTLIIGDREGHVNGRLYR